MISLASGWLFIHVPKTGGNSLQAVLAPFGDDLVTEDEYRDGVEDFEIAGMLTTRKHASLQEYHDILPAADYQRLFRFATIRDPWERAISAYFGPIRWHDNEAVPEWSPSHFVEITRPLESMTALVTVDGIVDLDAILPFERLDEAATGLFALLGIGDTRLPRLNTSLVTTPWQSYYERHPELVDFIAELWADDVANFGYAPPL